MKAWIFQRPEQVRKLGTELSAWYIGWYAPDGRRRAMSCGAGDIGRKLALRRVELLQAEATAGVYSDLGRKLDPALVRVVEGEKKKSPRVPNDPPAWRREAYLRTGCEVLVYFVEAEGVDRIKIGSTADLKKRLADLRNISPITLHLLAVVEGGVAVERTLHDRFASSRLHGEWFAASPELRALIQDIQERTKSAEALETAYGSTTD